MFHVKHPLGERDSQFGTRFGDRFNTSHVASPLLTRSAALPTETLGTGEELASALQAYDRVELR
jgi:hypothetical protein